MKIAVDARMINESGIGKYLRNLIFHLQKLGHKHEYFILLLKKDYESLEFSEIATSSLDKLGTPRNDGVEGEGDFHKILADFRWYTLEEQIKLPRILMQIKPDLVHFPHFNVPIFYRGKFVVTIHDLVHQHFSFERTTHGPIKYGLKHLAYKSVFKNAIERTLKILVPSEYVKKQLLSNWKVNNRKIVVTPEAVDDKLLTVVNNLNNERSRRILNKWSIKSQYIFYVGNAHPHKNIEGLIKAFIRLKDSGQSQNDTGNLQLVLSGQESYFWKKIQSSTISHQLASRSESSGIVYTGFISDEELVALYKNAKAFVMPSYEEGFGIPLLEAMALGCPVVSSNTASLPEVGGDAAIYFDPQDLGDMVDKIDMVLKSEKLRQNLIKKGKERVKKFSWKKLAKQTLEVYQKCM